LVDADLTNYFGEIPHADLLKSAARRVSDGRLLGWVKAWLEMAVDFAVLGQASASVMLAAVEGLMKRLKLPMNAEDPRLPVPEEPMTFLGYRIGRNHRRDTSRAYIGTRPSPASVQTSAVE